MDAMTENPRVNPQPETGNRTSDRPPQDDSHAGNVSRRWPSAGRVELSFHGESDTGQRRSNNEDGFLVDEGLHVFAVCDGLGGRTAGEVAASLALETVADVVRERRPSLATATVEELGQFAEDVVHAASREVYRRAIDDSSCAGMATTLTFVAIIGTRAVVGHVGDCRLYLFRQGSGHLLTTDHTVAGDLVRSGELDPTQAHRSPYSSVLTRALGPQSLVQPDSLVFDLAPGDWLLLCSDGLIRHVPLADEIGRLLEADESDVQKVVTTLVETANERGGEDNITVVAVRVDAVGQERSNSHHEILTRLRENPLFRGLSLEKLLAVLGAVKIQRYQAGEPVITGGSEVRGLHVVLDGTLEAEDLDHRPLSAGAYVGVLSLFGKRTAKQTLRAAQDARVLLVDRGSLRPLLKKRPRLGQKLLKRALQVTGEALERDVRPRAERRDGGEPAADLFAAF